MGAEGKGFRKILERIVFMPFHWKMFSRESLEMDTAFPYRVIGLGLVINQEEMKCPENEMIGSSDLSRIELA